MEEQMRQQAEEQKRRQAESQKKRLEEQKKIAERQKREDEARRQSEKNKKSQIAPSEFSSKYNFDGKTQEATVVDKGDNFKGFKDDEMYEGGIELGNLTNDHMLEGGADV